MLARRATRFHGPAPIWRKERKPGASLLCFPPVRFCFIGRPIQIKGFPLQKRVKSSWSAGGAASPVRPHQRRSSMNGLFGEAGLGGEPRRYSEGRGGVEGEGEGEKKT